jgi:hypothetical protein
MLVKETCRALLVEIRRLLLIWSFWDLSLRFSKYFWSPDLQISAARFYYKQKILTLSFEVIRHICFLCSTKSKKSSRLLAAGRLWLCKKEEQREKDRFNYFLFNKSLETSSKENLQGWFYFYKMENHNFIALWIRKKEFN